MRCPVCKSPLMVVEWRQIELDHCPRCQGTWFDAGELDLLLRGIDLEVESGLRDLLARPEAETDEKRVKCPRCRHKMRKVRATARAQAGGDAGAAAPGPLLDVCARGDGIWFDRGEVSALAAALSRAGSAATAHVGGYLGDLFR